MCGIVGIAARDRLDDSLLRRMIGQLAHRGPDDEGIWTDRGARIGFGHRRLAIIDLSAAGHQPMVSSDGRWVLTYNGEIYNHSELRAELEAAAPPEGGWRGHSDSETLVECISAWGLERTLAKLVGMFAIALWDRQTRQLHLIRDRFGEKPLYYGWVGGNFVFASELQALRVVPGFDNCVDRRALGLFTRLGYVPAPLTIFERIYKLEPGCILTASGDDLRTPLAVAPVPGDGIVRRYWSYRQVVEGGAKSPFTDEMEALDRLEQALLRSVAGQLIADVPVGLFLSGGIDSSTVAALCSRHSRVRTFTIGFEEAAYDEAPRARAIAAHLGTDHHEAYVTAIEVQSVIPMLGGMYGEPFADSSQIPTYLVSKYAREHVKVALSGDGGDELFGGYNRYIGASRIWSQAQMLPRPVRAAAGAVLGGIPASWWSAASAVAHRRRRPAHIGIKTRKAMLTLARARNIDELHDSFVDEWHAEAAPVLGATDIGLERVALGGGVPDAARMMYRDAVSYLPDDILCKVDRAAMAVSLETRVPFLDHRVAEIAARIPLKMKISGGTGKQPLRRLLETYIPAALLAHPKTGFGGPVGDWLRGPLRPLVEELLDPRRLREGGFFDPASIRSRWEAHRTGQRDSTAALWYILMFEGWRDHWETTVPLAGRGFADRSVPVPVSAGAALGG